MIRSTGTIEDFILIKDNCIFCGNGLTPTLTNSVSLFAPNMADINSSLTDDHFQFKLKHDGDQVRFHVSVMINIIDGRFNYYYHNDSQPVQDEVVKNSFVHMRPCVRLVCQDKLCGTGYCVESDPLRIIGESDHIRPVGIWAESFMLNDWWVANMYDSMGENISDTLIYSQSHATGGIFCPRLDFEAGPKDKLFNKIRTIVNFS